MNRFLLMGREIVAVDEVPAGNIFGIYGLEGAIMKMGTLSDHADCPSLSSLRLAVFSPINSHPRADPIVQIAVETKKPNDIPLLLEPTPYPQQQRQQHSRVPNGVFPLFVSFPENRRTHHQRRGRAAAGRLHDSARD